MPVTTQLLHHELQADLHPQVAALHQQPWACCMWHAGVYAALRAAGKKADLSLVVADEPAVAAGCFTKNVMCAAPVLYCKDVLDRKQKIKAVRTYVVLIVPSI